MPTIILDRTTSKNLLRLQNSSKLVKLAIRKAFHKIGKDLKETGSKELLYRPKSGRLYKVKINGVTYNHRASAPGESPANLTGALRRSLNYKVSSSYEMRWEAGGGEVDYASELEFGSPRVAKRPYMLKSITLNRRNIGNHFLKEIKKSVNGK